ncbi:MAG: hypothetical protein ACRD0K_07915 [Egibacteraceae bacterium]
MRRNEPNRRFRPYLCRIFGTNDTAELGLGRSWAAWPYWTVATDEERKAEVERRVMLRAAGLLAVGGLLPRGTTAVEPHKLDASWLREAESMTDLLAHAYRTTAPGIISGPVLAHMDKLRSYIGAPGLPADRARLDHAIADVASFAGLLQFRLDLLDASARCFGIAERHAREAEDSALLAQVLGAKSYLYSTVVSAGLRGDARAALSTLEQANDLIPADAPRRARALLLARLAEERASVGDSEGCHRALSGAESLLDGPNDDDTLGFFGNNGLYSLWDEAYFDGFRGVCGVLLSEPATVDVLSDTLAHTTSTVRKAIVLTDLAGAYAGVEMPELAAGTLGEARDLTVDIRFPLAMQRIMGTRARFNPCWTQMRCVRELDDRLRVT